MRYLSGGGQLPVGSSQLARPWDDLENYYLVRFQEVLTPVRVSGVGTGGDTVRSPSN